MTDLTLDLKPLWLRRLNRLPILDRLCGCLFEPRVRCALEEACLTDCGTNWSPENRSAAPSIKPATSGWPAATSPSAIVSNRRRFDAGDSPGKEIPRRPLPINPSVVIGQLQEPELPFIGEQKV